MSIDNALSKLKVEYQKAFNDLIYLGYTQRNAHMFLTHYLKNNTGEEK